MGSENHPVFNVGSVFAGCSNMKKSDSLLALREIFGGSDHGFFDMENTDHNIPLPFQSSDWKKNVTIVLGCMDLDLALRIEPPTDLTDKSSTEEKQDFERWDHSNRMSLMIIKRGIPETFRDTMSDKITSAKGFLGKIEKGFAKNYKAETSTLLASLISMRYKENDNIREYIMKMSHLASKLGGTKVRAI